MSHKKQTYVKKDPISHILDRPDMYVGSTRSRQVEEFVVVDDNYNIAKKSIDISPAILRIFIEPLSNVIDNVARSKQNKNKVSKIVINIDEKTGLTSFWNDGDIIPVETHEQEGCYNHTMIFGHLLTSSNYDDEQDREDISGRNGLGVKLTNVFSKQFTVEGGDSKNKKQFKQVWTNNMRNVSAPEVENTKTVKNYTQVSFTPDFKHFGLENYTTDIISLFRRFAVDTAMVTKIPVFLNDKEIPVKTLTDYAKLFSRDESPSLLPIKTTDCEVVVMESDTQDFQAISFANGVYTPLGGTHVDSWSEAIFRPIVDKLNKPKKPQVNITEVKKYFRLFVVATVKKPEFDSQSKTKLEKPNIVAETKAAHITAIMKWPVIGMIEDIIHAKEMIVLKKAERKKRGHVRVEGLEPANNEGGNKSHDCTLILVEGLSAKTYAALGIQRGAFGKQGRDWFGIYALRGKVLNCRNFKPLTISKNNVVTDIIQALGIQYGVDYSVEENYRKLRYGKVMIVTDADSVTGDTPLLLKQGDQIKIKTIDSIGGDWVTDSNGKEYSQTDLSVWSDNGWTKIKGIMRHKVAKKIYRVVTNDSVVDVTEDHSLLDHDGLQISPKNVRIGTQLLHSFPVLDINNIQNSTNLTQQEAYVMGFFYLYGQYNNNNWLVYHDDVSLIQVCQYYIRPFAETKLENCSELEYQKYGKIFKLTSVKDESYLKNWRDMFYENETKKVPEIILSSNSYIQKSFIFGMGDPKSIRVKSKIEAQRFYYIAKSLNYKVSIDCFDNDYILLINNVDYLFKNTIKKIYKLDNKEQYVYDLETENHHFQAGIGQLIVHNTDGLHISGLIQNMFHYLFPSLLKRQTPFITAMQTPIVRVYLGRTDKLFYDEQEYRRYVRENQGKKINKKYYKGLGSSNEDDVLETFGQKLIEFKEDTHTFENMIKAFHCKYADKRKEWLAQYDPNQTVLKWEGNKEEKYSITFSDYINTELIKFSMEDCKRSIPNLMDGLKEGHRKILYVSFLRNLKYTGKTIKVAQLGGSVSEKAGYHHGEKNLEVTMTGMANSYVGSNNIPLLFRDGQFGSRAEGGKDAAAGRYIWTKLDAMTRLIFREEDDCLLEHVEDDGDKVEPKFYVPIIPMILVNGCLAGIGTGWSCSIPCYNPLDIIECIKSWLNNGNKGYEIADNIMISMLPELKPWYRGHNGEMVKEGEGKFTSWGKIEKDNKGKVHITELPVGLWTSKFTQMLEKMREEKQISSYKNHSTPKDIHYIITETDDGITCDLKNLKLSKVIRTSNMVLFTEQGFLRKFNTPEEIIDNFCQIRYQFYVKRKVKQLKDLERQIKILGNKKRFLEEVRDGEIKLFEELKGNKKQSRKTDDIVAELEKRGYDKDFNDKDKPKEEDETEDEKEVKGHGYEYLLRLQISSITAEKIDKLKNDIANRKSEHDHLYKKSEKDIWLDELEQFKQEYLKWLPVINNEKQSKLKKDKK
jgi:DNA gyrase/topoisomerase IV subunit B